MVMVAVPPVPAVILAVAWAEYEVSVLFFFIENVIVEPVKSIAVPAESVNARLFVNVSP